MAVTAASEVYTSIYMKETCEGKRSCEIDNLLKTHICKLGLTIPSRVLRGA